MAFTSKCAKYTPVWIVRGFFGALILNHYDVGPSWKVIRLWDSRGQGSGAAGGVAAERPDGVPRATRDGCAELKRRLNCVQNAALEWLTLLPLASTFNGKPHEHKKDSDWPALEKERHRGGLPGDSSLQRSAQYDRGATKIRGRGRSVDATARREYSQRAWDTGVFAGTGRREFLRRV